MWLGIKEGGWIGRGNVEKEMKRFDEEEGGNEKKKVDEERKRKNGIGERLKGKKKREVENEEIGRDWKK